VRKTITQPWQVRLVFGRDHDEVIELPATMSAREVWKHIQERYHGTQPAIHILTRGRKQMKMRA